MKTRLVITCKNPFLIIFIYFLSIHFGFSQDVRVDSYKLYSREIDSLIVLEGGSPTLMAQKSLERNREFNKKERENNNVPKELKGFRLISTVVNSSEINGTQSFNFIHEYYWFMKNKSTTTSHNVVMNYEGKVFKITRDEAIQKLKEAKELLDLEIITQEEFDKIKEKYTPFIINQ
jgi:hypothetical protein